MNKLSQLLFGSMLAVTGLSACSDDSTESSNLGPLTPEEDVFGKATGNFTAEEWFPGGALGTTENASYSAITPAAEQAGMATDYKDAAATAALIADQQTFAESLTDDFWKF